MMKLDNVKKILDKVCKKEDGWIIENETEDTNILYSKPLLSDSVVAYNQKYITIEIIQEEDWEVEEEGDIISFVISEIIISHPFLGEENPVIFNRDEDIVISLPKFLNILNKNLIDIKLEILKKYIDITEKFKSTYEPILLDFGFISYRDSALTENLFSSYGYNSPIFKNKFEYIHKETSIILVFTYDYLTDDLYCFLNDSFESINDIFLLTVQEFYISISTIMSKEQRFEYLLSSDPKHTKYTYNIVNSLMDGITMLSEHNRFPHISKNDLFRYDETDKERVLKRIISDMELESDEKLINKYESLKQKYYDDNNNNTSKDNN